MMQFEKKIKVIKIENGERVKRTKWAKQFNECEEVYDMYGQLWKVMKDIHFDKYFYREVVTEK